MNEIMQPEPTKTALPAKLARVLSLASERSSKIDPARPTVVYHHADFDGIFCREIAHKFLPDAELTGWDYADTPVDFPPDGMVYILDLSPACFKSLPDINEVGRRVIWIDHHKTAIDKWPSEIPGYRIDGVAACRLAWQWFARSTNKLPTKEDFLSDKISEPLAVRLAGLYAAPLSPVALM